MKQKQDILMDNKIFLWGALASVLVLLVPAGLMLFQIPLLDPGSGYEVINWELFDFVVMGFLLFGAGSVFVILARKFKNNRAVLAIAIAILFLLAWAHLAVGIVDTWPLAGS